MAKLGISTSNALTRKAWTERLYRDTIKEAYFTQFMGEDTESMVYVQNKLEKEKGDRITFGIRMRATGAGVTSGTVLEGNEEALSTHSFNLTLEQYRHAVRDDGAMSRQRASFNVTGEMEAAIKDWGSEKIDSLLFASLAASASQVVYRQDTAGALKYTTALATAKADINATNSKLTPGLISYAKAMAKTGHGRDFVPMRPIKVNGRSYYVLLVHPDVMYDLKTNSDFQQAFREAEVRGSENPLFKGATAIWDGVVIHEHENITTFTDGGGASEPGAYCFLLGAQSLCWGWGRRPRVVQRDFDYENEIGVSYEIIAAAGKPQFNSKDYGSLAVVCARTQVSDAA